MTTRRDFIRHTAAATAASAAGAPPLLEAANVVTDASKTQLKWSKAPCRFCGVGCGVNVAVKDGRVVATHGHAEPFARYLTGLGVDAGVMRTAWESEAGADDSE